MANTLAAIHKVDVDAVGLGQFGRRENYCRRQVRDIELPSRTCPLVRGLLRTRFCFLLCSVLSFFLSLSLFFFFLFVVVVVG